MKKLDITFVRDKFEEKGWELLTTEYSGSQKQLDVKCPKGHLTTITWNNFQSEQGCRYCAENVKYTYDEVKDIFKQGGCELLSKEYINNFEPLIYRCSCRNISKIALRDFLVDVRCNECKPERIAEKLRTPRNVIEQFCSEHGFELVEIIPEQRRTRITHKCLKCNNIHSQLWGNFQKCNTCRNCKRIASEEQKQLHFQSKKKNNNYDEVLVEPYVQDFNSWVYENIKNTKI